MIDGDEFESHEPFLSSRIFSTKYEESAYDIHTSSTMVFF